MIRDKIKEAMKLREVRAKDLAENIGVTKSSMSMFLNGKMKLGMDKVEHIFKLLGIDLIIKNDYES